MWLNGFPTLEGDGPTVTYDPSMGAKHTFRVSLNKDWRIYLTQQEAQLLSVQINAALYEAYTTTEDDES